MKDLNIKLTWFLLPGLTRQEPKKLSICLSLQIQRLISLQNMISPPEYGVDGQGVLQEVPESLIKHMPPTTINLKVPIQSISEKSKESKYSFRQKGPPGWTRLGQLYPAGLA
jgi:hypothetical protein